MSPAEALGKTVLIVEDDADLLGAIEEALQDAGYHVVAASDGAAALAVLREVPVALVVSDLAMPNMDGMALIQAGAANPATAHVPIILMTGSERMSPLPPGCVAALPKPFSLQALLVVVRQHLDLVQA